MGTVNPQLHLVFDCPIGKAVLPAVLTFGIRTGVLII